MLRNSKSSSRSSSPEFFSEPKAPAPFSFYISGSLNSGRKTLGFGLLSMENKGNPETDRIVGDIEIPQCDKTLLRLGIKVQPTRAKEDGYCFNIRETFGIQLIDLTDPNQLTADCIKMSVKFIETFHPASKKGILIATKRDLVTPEIISNAEALLKEHAGDMPYLIIDTTNVRDLLEVLNTMIEVSNSMNPKENLKSDSSFRRPI